MAQDEGVIRFSYALKAPSAPIADALAQPLLAWRAVLRRLGLIGQRPDRYGGFGYGNLSRRAAGGEETFIITASQTGGAAQAGLDDLVRIDRCDLNRFHADAEGVKPPSSESLTHAMVYHADADIHWVLHGHSPDIWGQAPGLGLPTIAADVEYGSWRMAKAVAALLSSNATRPLVFATLGHRDGVFACGEGAEHTGGALIQCLGRSLVLASTRSRNATPPTDERVDVGMPADAPRRAAEDQDATGKAMPQTTQGVVRDEVAPHPLPLPASETGEP